MRTFLTNPPPVTAERVGPRTLRRYRKLRFGAAGAFGNGGVAKAAKRHGVGRRAWFHYEAGERTPPLVIRRAVARWLNRYAGNNFLRSNLAGA